MFEASESVPRNELLSQIWLRNEGEIKYRIEGKIAAASAVTWITYHTVKTETEDLNVPADLS